jgi:hypothetical protein
MSVWAGRRASGYVADPRAERDASNSRSMPRVTMPPGKPLIVPSAPITRWQGTTNGSGLTALAAPTARVAKG